MNITPPTYLEGNLKNIHIKKTRLKAQLISTSGNELFQLFYFGEHFKDTLLLTEKDNIPQRLIAKEVNTNEEILLFDAGKHGYNAMFCDEHLDTVLQNRTLQALTTNNQTIFKVHLTIHYNIDYEDPAEEFLNELDDEQNITLINGKKAPFTEVKKNGFDALVISIIDQNGQEYDIIDEELA